MISRTNSFLSLTIPRSGRREQLVPSLLLKPIYTTLASILARRMLTINFSSFRQENQTMASDNLSTPALPTRRVLFDLPDRFDPSQPQQGYFIPNHIVRCRATASYSTGSDLSLCSSGKKKKSEFPAKAFPPNRPKQYLRHIVRVPQWRQHLKRPVRAK